MSCERIFKYKVLHSTVNSLNLLKESAIGEKMTSWTVYSAANYFLFSAHKTYSKTSMAGTKESMARTRLYSAVFNYREIQKILSQNVFKRSLGPVYQSSNRAWSRQLEKEMHNGSALRL